MATEDTQETVTSAKPIADESVPLVLVTGATGYILYNNFLLPVSIVCEEQSEA